MLLLSSGSGLHSRTNASATRVPTSFLMALWTSAYASSCPNPHLCVICTRSTPFRREKWSAPFCPRNKSLNSPDCGIFFKLPPLRLHRPAVAASHVPCSKSDKQVSKTPMAASKNSGKIYIGVGGWTFAPWRGVFYPEKLTQAKELEYAASKLTSIEINGTYYGSQKPESFRKWAREVPDGFVFLVKGPRFATNRRGLGEAGESIKRIS